MRQIGVNQFAGDHPAIIEAMNEIGNEIAKAKIYRQELFDKKTPAEKFLHLLNEKVISTAFFLLKSLHKVQYQVESVCVC